MCPEYAEWRDPVYGLDAYRRMEDSDRKPKRRTVLKSRLGYWYNIARRRQLLTSRVRRHFIVPYHLEFHSYRMTLYHTTSLQITTAAQWAAILFES